MTDYTYNSKPPSSYAAIKTFKKPTGTSALPLAVNAPTNSGKTYSGNAVPNEAVTIKLNTVTIATILADNVGNWTYTFVNAPLPADNVVAYGTPRDFIYKVPGNKLPITLNDKLVFAGDSIFQAALVGSSAQKNLQSLMKGEMNVARMLSPRYNMDSFCYNRYDVGNNPVALYYDGGNQGASGDTSSGLLKRIQQILSLRPDVVVLAIGINDYLAAANNIPNIITALRNGGVKKIVLCTMRPTRSTDEGNHQKLLLQAENAKLVAMAALDVIICDLYSAYNQGDGYISTLDSADALHPTVRGAVKGGKALKAILDTLFPAGNVFDALFAGTNALLPAGVGYNLGSVAGPGTGITGFVPANLLITRSSNGNIVGSLEANAQTGGQTAVFVITPGTGTTGQITVTPNPANYAYTSASKWFKIIAELELSGWDQWIVPTIAISKRPFDATLYSSAFTVDNVVSMINPSGQPALDMHVSSEPIQFDSATTGFYPSIKMNWNETGATGTGTLKVKRWGVFEIPDPRILWNR